MAAVLKLNIHFEYHPFTGEQYHWQRGVFVYEIMVLFRACFMCIYSVNQPYFGFKHIKGSLIYPIQGNGFKNRIERYLLSIYTIKIISNICLPIATTELWYISDRYKGIDLIELWHGSHRVMNYIH